MQTNNKHQKRIDIDKRGQQEMLVMKYTSQWIAELEEYFGYPMPPSILSSYETIECELQKKLDEIEEE